jgi:hypothetical protein
VRGVVTSEIGRVGANLVSIQDGAGGLAIRLPAGMAAPERGHLIDLVGELAAPYGQLEVRPAAAADVHDLGDDALPSAVVLSGDLDELLEGLLVTVEGQVPAAPSTSNGDVTLDLDEATKAGSVQSDASAVLRRHVCRGALPRDWHRRAHASTADALTISRVAA